MKTLAILAALGIFSVVAHARIVGTAPTDPDAWCVQGQQGHVGGSQTGAEVCVDASGNIVPTVTGVQTLGSSTLAWLSAFITNLTVSGNFTPQSLTTAQVQAKTPSAVGQVIYNSTLNNICVSTGTVIQGYKLVGTTSTTCQ